MNEFWDLTPREVYLYFEAARRRRRRQDERDARQAWITARLVRSKQVPALASLLGARPARPISGDELDTKRREHEEIVGRLWQPRAS